MKKWLKKKKELKIVVLSSGLYYLLLVLLDFYDIQNIFIMPVELAYCFPFLDILKKCKKILLYFIFIC